MPLLVEKTVNLLIFPATYVPDLLFFVGSWILFEKLNRLVSWPYIDELFHVKQCQQYCRHNFNEWDNKITTPPGLYILGYLYTKSISLISRQDVCGNISWLRSLNMVGGTMVFPYTLSKIKNRNTWAVNIAFQPLLFIYYFLFYTDVWSTIFIVISLSIALRNRSATGATASAFMGFVSLWFRQTNIIWVAFILSVVLNRTVDESRFDRKVLHIIKTSPQNWKLILPFLINFVLFGIFLKVNGGIAFGDKENHQIHLHLVQVFYCLAFITAFSWPSWISFKLVNDYLNSWKKYFFINAVFLVFIHIIVDRFTVVHPFLLADNRHYTFYIFRKIIRHRYSQFLTVPVYHFSSWGVFHVLKKSKKIHLLPLLSYIIAICLTLIPSPLFEPRYYIVPMILFKIYTQPVDKKRNLLDFLWIAFLNILTLSIFINYEFTWPSEPDKIQRIIW